MNAIKPTFQDEVMLAGWSETHNGGAKVTFWLNDSSALEAFKRMTVAKGKTAGQRLACVLVEIDDSENPKDNNHAKKESKGGALSVWLALRCKEQNFWSFIENQCNYVHGGYITSESQCDREVKNYLGIESKTELDNNKEAEKRFHQTIRLPYSEWLIGRR